MIQRRLIADLTIVTPQLRHADRWTSASATSRWRDRGKWRPVLQSVDRDGIGIGALRQDCVNRPLAPELVPNISG